MIEKSIIEEIANDYQIDVDEFEKAVTSTEVVEFDIDTKVKHFLTDDQKKTLEENLELDVGKKKYEEGKVAEREMTMKNLNEKHKVFTDFDKFEKHGFDYETTTWTQFFDASASKQHQEYKDKIESLEKQMNGNESDTVKELQIKIDEKITEANDLKGSLKEQKENFDKQLSDRDIADLNIKKDLFYNKGASSVPFDSSHMKTEEDVQKFLLTQKEHLAQLFKNAYDIEYDEGGVPVLIDKKTKEKMVDGIKNPLPINEVMLKFAKEGFMQIEADVKRGRGGENSKGSFSGARGIKTMEEFHNHCKEKDIQQNSKEADALYKEVIKHNPEIQ